jgi:glycosyltransferase involved in cell wall biosynthesis
MSYLLIDSKEGNGCAMAPKVTIGICVRNCERSVIEAMSGIIDQDFPHELMEVIFVDDGSEDGTLQAILDSISRMDIRVKIFSGQWSGLGSARNVVVDNVRGDYIVWVDGDMILPKDHVRKQVEFMEQNPKVGIAKAKYGMLAIENIVAALENIPFIVDNSKDEKGNPKLPGTGGSIYRVEAIRQVGGFDNHLKGVGEDQDAAYRVKAKGWFLERSPAVFYENRVQTWKDLWDKYLWYGYGDYALYRKNRSVFSLHKMVPPAGFIAGLLYSRTAYRLMRRKVIFLMPFHYTFKMVAWCVGFAKGHIDFVRRVL